MNKKDIILKIGIFIIALIMLIIGINTTKSSTHEERKVQLEVALNRAVIECYALEGIYPPDLEYIKKQYGIRIDESEFIVYYDTFADNIMPNIVVLEKN